MTASLSLIETEAKHLIGRIPEDRRHAMQVALLELCEAHWVDVRGPEPVTRLSHTLWSITPPLADLFIDLFTRRNTKLWEIVPENTLTRGLALVVFAEIERANEAGVHIAHEPMMAFETTAPPAKLLERMSALLHGNLVAPLIHPHDKHGALWRALAVIAEKTRRTDLPAVLEVIHLLTVPADSHAYMPDPELEGLRQAMEQSGIRFLEIKDDHIRYGQHEHEHKPVRSRQIGEMLLEIRQQWLH